MADKLALAGTVLGLIVILNRSKNPYIRVALNYYFRYYEVTGYFSSIYQIYYHTTIHVSRQCHETQNDRDDTQSAPSVATKQYHQLFDAAPATGVAPGGISKYACRGNYNVVMSVVSKVVKCKKLFKKCNKC